MFLVLRTETNHLVQVLIVRPGADPNVPAGGPRPYVFLNFSEKPREIKEILSARWGGAAGIQFCQLL